MSGREKNYEKAVLRDGFSFVVVARAREFPFAEEGSAARKLYIFAMNFDSSVKMTPRP